MSASPVHAPLFGAGDPDRLRFSRLERQVLQIVQHHPESEFNRIVLRKNSRELALELCFERRNCIQWLPVAKTETVLEIGAGAGALTGEWAAKAARVAAVEPSPQRAYINAVRHRDRVNVEIHAGSFAETEKRLAGRKFDIIALIGSLATAELFVGAGPESQKQFLSRLQNLLADGGRIIVAVPNRFGLKFWAGGVEDRRECPFAGLEGHLDPGGGQPLSRKDLAQLAKESGFESAIFFYPYPDYRFASTIYSDDYLPRKGELCFNQFPWDAGTMTLFQPGKVFDELIHENLFPFFSNSFLVVLSQQALPPPVPDDRRIVYSKFSTKRRRALQIRTDILVDGRGAKSIRKVPYASEALPHVEGLCRQCEKLAQLYAGSPLVANRCELRSGAAELEYIEGPSLADGVLDRLRRGERAAFLTAMAEFFATVRSLATAEFRPTDEFRAVFGHVRLPSGLKSAPVSNIDLILPNVIVRAGRWHVIDYEWTFDFPIPVDYVLFRTLRYLFSYNRWICQHAGLEDELYQMANIGGEIRAYVKMELFLQNHIVPPGTFVQDLSPGEVRVPRKSRTALETLLIRWLPREMSERLARVKQLWTGRP